MMEIVVFLLPQSQGDPPAAGLSSANLPAFYLLRSDPAVQELLRLLVPLPNGQNETHCPALLTGPSLLPTVKPLPLSPAGPLVLPPSAFGWPLTAEILEALHASGVPENLLSSRAPESKAHPSRAHLVIVDSPDGSLASVLYSQFAEQLHAFADRGQLPPEFVHLPPSEQLAPPPGVPPVTFGYIDTDKWMLSELERLGFSRQFGAFKFLRFLGRGKTTSTFVARYTDRLAPLVVLKILRPAWMNHWTITQQVLMPPAASIHPAILPYESIGPYESIDHYESIPDDTKPPYLIIPLRQDLKSYFGSLCGSRRTVALLQALRDISEGLEFLHNRGAVHGAVKRSNILYDPPHFQLTDPSHSHIRSGERGHFLLLARRRSQTPSPEMDIKGLGHTLKALCRVQTTPLPTWAREVLDRCIDLNPTARPTAAEILHNHIIPYALPERGGLAILASTWSPEAATIRYDLDITGHRIAQVLESSVGERQLTDLCDLWHEIDQLTWSEVQEPHRGRLESLLEDAGAAASQGLLGQAYSPLREHLPLPLWLIYDPALAAVPWELMQVGAGRLCRQVPFSRSPRLGSAAAPHRQRIFAAERRVRVLIADFSGDLPFARDECRRLKSEFEDCCLADRLDIKVLDEGDRWQKLTDEIRKSDVIHFAGHAKFDTANPANSALILGNGERLPASSLLSYWREGTPPLLFFANGCAAAQSPPVSKGGFTGDARSGLGHALIAAGVASYIGPAWPIPDASKTAEFASAFYRHFFAGYSAAHAMHEARNACADRYGESDLVWARYILFGHPFNRIDLGLQSTP